MVTDCIVIGSGLAGFSAAITLKKRNKSVAVVTQHVGTTAVSSGAWDFGPLSDPKLSFDEWMANENHQKVYRQLLIDWKEIPSSETCKQAFKEISAALLPELKMESRFEHPFCLPTTSGRWKHTFVAQELQTSADLNQLKNKKVGLVTSRNWRFQGEALCKKWVDEARALGFELSIKPLHLDLELPGKDWPIPHLAARILHDKAFRDQFQNAVVKVSRETEFLLFPPLFLEGAIFHSLEKLVGIPMAEALSTSEPTAGQRLNNALYKSLSTNSIPLYHVFQLRRGVERNAVRNLQGQLQPSQEWMEFGAKHFILASGKFFGGGITLGYDQVSENVFDLPLFNEKSREPIRNRSELAWIDNRFDEEQNWAKLGVWLTPEWIPRDHIGARVFENVRACGSIIGGIDFARENVGLGFMAFSGRQSGLLVS